MHFLLTHIPRHLVRVLNHSAFIIACRCISSFVQVHDMIAGGVNRARWTRTYGDQALDAINAQRAITEIVKLHRHNQQSVRAHSSRSKAARWSEAAMAQEGDEDLEGESTEASAVAKLAAVEAGKCGYTRRQLKNRQRQFRKVRSRLAARHPRGCISSVTVWAVAIVVCCRQ